THRIPRRAVTQAWTHVMLLITLPHDPELPAQGPAAILDAERYIRPAARLDCQSESSAAGAACSEERQGFGRPGHRVSRLAWRPERPYATTVSRNWRMTFGWDGEDAVDVDLEDYHG